jgi:hypothetical protein
MNSAPALEASGLFGALKSHQPDREYNFAHFRPTHLFQDITRTVRGEGIQPGELAPDFELPRAGGGTLRLSDLRGKPVLLHFGSPT